jgi:hypothetical protein
METIFLFSFRSTSFREAFNFLASLINGNFFQHGKVLYLVTQKTFNFLASLINGNLAQYEDVSALY